MISILKNHLESRISKYMDVSMNTDTDIDLDIDIDMCIWKSSRYPRHSLKFWGSRKLSDSIDNSSEFQWTWNSNRTSDKNGIFKYFERSKYSKYISFKFLKIHRVLLVEFLKISDLSNDDGIFVNHKYPEFLESLDCPKNIWKT